MIPDLDIYRNANVLVKQHGEDAPVMAALGQPPNCARYQGQKGLG